MTQPAAQAEQPATTTIIRRAIRYGIYLTIAVVVVGGLIGFLAAGVLGLISALIGAGITAIFMGLTAVSFLVASRLGKLPEGIVIYYGVILGTFFIVLVVWLRSAHWLNPTVFGLTTIAAVLGTLVVDVVALQRGRVPYVDVALPTTGAHPPEKSPEDS